MFDVLSLMSTCKFFDDNMFIIKFGCSFIKMNKNYVVSQVTRADSNELHTKVIDD